MVGVIVLRVDARHTSYIILCTKSIIHVNQIVTIIKKYNNNNIIIIEFRNRISVDETTSYCDMQTWQYQLARE